MLESVMTTGSTKPRSAADIMSKSVISLKASTSLRDAWQIFSEHKISGAPVVTSNGQLVGIVSQTDLARRVFSEGGLSSDPATYFQALPFVGDGFIPSGDSFNKLAEIPVEEVMNPYVVTVTPIDDIASVATTMRAHKIHRIIVTEGDRVVGIVSTFDLLGLLESYA